MKGIARTITNRELIKLMPPRLDLQDLGWVLEEYWDEASRHFFAETRNSYNLQIHRPAVTGSRKKGKPIQLIGRLMLCSADGAPIAWAECEGTQHSYFKISILIGSRDPRMPIWQDRGKSALETLVSAITILLDPDQVVLSALGHLNLETLGRWNIGVAQSVWTPPIDSLSVNGPEALQTWQYFVMDLSQFKDSANGQELRKSLNYLQLRKARTIKALDEQHRPVRKRQGFLARIFQSKK